MTLLGIVSLWLFAYIVFGVLGAVTSIGNGSFAAARVKDDGTKVSALLLFLLIVAVWPWFVYLEWKWERQ